MLLMGQPQLPCRWRTLSQMFMPDYKEQAKIARRFSSEARQSAQRHHVDVSNMRQVAKGVIVSIGWRVLTGIPLNIPVIGTN
jgi:hypothetical protein